MTSGTDKGPTTSRRLLFRSAGGLVAAGGVGLLPVRPASAADATPEAEPFWGDHQAGIVSLAQAHTYFATFDLTTAKRTDVESLLRLWTAAAARLTAGQAIEPAQLAAGYDEDPPPPVPDSGEASDLKASRLTITFGFGPGLFVKDGKDRYGLSALRPAAFVDLPKFNGDQLVPEMTGGDLSVQACADDSQVAFHAIRSLALLADGVAQMRWAQTGFLSAPSGGKTPRNLMGFKDGTQRPAQVDKAVWVGAEGPDWMRGGSYLVARRIRIALEHWDRTPVSFQEQTIGRQKLSGAPLGLKDEFAPLGLERTDTDDNPVIPEHAHVRMANAGNIGAAEMLRRAYNYNDGLKFTAERWPPWRQGTLFDAGLLFICYQNDPRTGFVKTFEDMAKFDMLNQFTTHVGGGLFACPPGVRAGGFVGERLFRGA
jgi:deferrochelatase/peroxidase EfeB